LSVAGFGFEAGLLGWLFTVRIGQLKENAYVMRSASFFAAGASLPSTMTSTWFGQICQTVCWATYLHGTAVDLDAVQLGDGLDGAGGIGEDHVGDSTALPVRSVHQEDLLDRGNCLLEVVLWK
jgi:hypothetical protein